MIYHPLLRFNGDQRRALFGAFLALTIAIMVSFRFIDRPLQTTAAPQGIVSFELAGNTVVATRIVDSWDARARIYAGFSLGFDYLFMVAYAVSIALACLGLKSPRSLNWRWWQALGVALAWGVALAAGFDAVENAALWQSLVRAPAAPWPALAATCAVVKFVLIGLGLIYVLVGALLWVLGNRMGSDASR